jgi:Mechanosensitive ion channel, conserved TM helix
MLETLQRILEQALQQLTYVLQAFVPPLLAGAAVLLVFYVVAAFGRWLINRIFKGTAVDRFLSQSGISTMIDRSGRLRARRVASAAVFWIIFGIGLLTALSAFNTAITTRMVDSLVSLFPKLVTAGAILLGGVWLAQYFARTLLVWAVNESVPAARYWAAAVRIVIIFAAVVVAADHLDFARSVFLAAFILLVGALALAAALAVGLGARDAVRRQLSEDRQRDDYALERSLQDHL